MRMLHGNIALDCFSGIPTLSDSYHALNAQRVTIDRRFAILAPDDPTRDALWQEVGSVLVNLGKIVSQLAECPPAHLSELGKKADVLASLLRPGEDGGPIVSDDQKEALALSLAGDLARLCGECEKASRVIISSTPPGTPSRS
jgi:hypothetical protein